MDKEEKKIIMYGLVALVVMGIVFGVLFAMKSGKSDHHSHGDGVAHSH